MPVYEVEMSDGRKFQVEADKPPTEADITEHLKGKPNTQTATSEQFAPKPDESALVNPPTAGGFIKNLGRDAMDMGKSMLQAGGARAGAGRNFDAVGTTRPSNVANFVKSRAAADTDPAQIYQRPAAFLADAAAVADMAPGVGRGVMEAGRQVGRVSGPAGAMAKGAAMETPILGKMAKGAIRGLEKYNKASAPVESANAGGALGGKAPSLEDALNEALQSQMAPAKPTRTTAAPEPTITPSGKEGEFQSSGRPSVSGDAGYKPRFERAVGFEPEPPPDIDSAVDSELQSALEGASAGVPEEGMTLDEEGRPLAPAEKPMDPHYAEYMKSRKRSGNTFKSSAEADARNLAVDQGMGGKGADLPGEVGGDEMALEPEVDNAVEDDNDVSDATPEVGGYQVGINPADDAPFTADDARAALESRGHKSTELIDDADPSLHLASLHPDAEKSLLSEGMLEDEFDHGGRRWRIDAEVPDELMTGEAPEPAPEAFRDVTPPEKWHSGAKPGSADAKRMSQSHREDAEADAMYRLLTEDSRKPNE